jgi:nicotinamide mononucleotide transporter
MPYLDAFTTVTSVVAMVLSVKMFSEQWWIWVIVDVMTVVMWAINFAQGQDNIATLLMWIVYLGNAVLMLVKWEKEAHARDKECDNV